MSTKEVSMKNNSDIGKAKEVKQELLAEGIWSDGTKWKFVVGQHQPDEKVCTAVFGVVTHESKVAVVKHARRGWELPGGHLEPGEDVLIGLQREVLEEAGLVISDGKYFGYKHIAPPAPIPHRSGFGFYPFPDSFVPYFVSEVNEVLAIPLSDDVVAITLVSPDEAMVLCKQSSVETGINHHHDRIISYCVKQGLIV